MFKNYICAIDIGSSKISAVLAKLEKKRLAELYFETAGSRGLKAGAITDSIELTGCIERLLKKLKAVSGINIRVVYANISGQDIVAKHSRAILPLAERGNKIITLSDIYRANDMARVLGSSLEEEIIHQVPFGYAIDSQNGIINPLGLYSHRLEVDMFLICAKMSSVQSLIRAINQAGYEAKDLLFSGIATSRVVFGPEIREGVSCLCDIGSDITEILIFKDGLLKSVSILPQGGDGLTAKISEALKVPFELADEIKKANSSIGDPSLIDEERQILIKKNDAYKPVKQKVVSEIVTAEANVLCRDIRRAIEKTLPVNHVNNLVVTGRAVLLDGFLETLENSLGVSVKLGRINNPEISALANRYEVLAGQKYLAYLTPLGMICQVRHLGDPYFLPSDHQPSRNLFLRLLNRAKEVYQEYF